VGELGTNTEQLEKKLQEILELAAIWQAVVLIDEADVSVPLCFVWFCCDFNSSINPQTDLFGETHRG
jgi:hypothetical protein